MSRLLCLLMLAPIMFFFASRFTKLINTASAQPTIQLIPVASGLSSPLYATSARDGSNRLFIVEQTGSVKVLMPGAGVPLQTPFLDIASKIVSGGEQGLLGLAFHPQYTSNGRFFVNYTRRPDGATVVSEFKVSAGDPNVAETQERIIITIQQPFANHNGGWIDFGPDGFLYIGMGDGGSGNDPGNRAQNINDLLGKMLRLDVNTNGTAPYVSPSTNPFFGSTPGRDEIYATGLRNPFRCSFDRATGMLYAGDVGQGLIEEISIITLGGNYGWRVYEGTRCTNLGPAPCVASNYVMPLLEYNHSNGRCSVTGGYVYRGAGNSLPAGAYVYADFCTGEIFMRNGGSTSLIRDTDLLISSFGEDEAGEIYVLGLGGTIHRLAAPTIATPVSAASYRGTQLALDSIVAAFGQNFATSAQFPPANQPLPTTLAGASVNIIDAKGASHPAQLFFVSPTQINFLIPRDAAPGNGTLSVTNTNGTISAGAFNISTVAPGLFAVNASGSGIAAAVVLRVKADGSQIFEPIVQLDAQNQFVPIPIDLGPDLGNATDRVFLITFGTGFRFRSSLGAVTATVGGEPALTSFAGTQPDFFGLDQASLLLPRSLIGRRDVDVVLTVDGQMTNAVRVVVK
ncbi:MAG TPA: PQQ-dependent sugar dehydrogenase [Blastocatellia bacterium]|nr:PQQ-dependent sugar dehydrogenase [Blastocatellia bacterium]